VTWPVVALTDVAEVRLGRQRAPKNHSGDSMRPYIRAANVKWTGLDLTDVKTMNFTDTEMSTYRMEPGDIVLSEASGSPGEVGKPALWSGEIADCAFQNTLIRVRSTVHEPRFLTAWARMPSGIAQDDGCLHHESARRSDHLGLDTGSSAAWRGLTPEYLEAVWNSPQNRATLSDIASSSSGLHTLSVSKLKHLFIPVPSVERQRELLVRVAAIRETRARLDASIAVAIKRRLALRRSLLAVAFSGNLTGSAGMC
jgi:hypothetical protein